MNNKVEHHHHNFDYESHPAFLFDHAGWSFPQDEVNSFNSTYESIREFGLYLKKSELIILKNKCFSDLAEVFEIFDCESSDEYEKYFLNELRTECFRVLSEEFFWFLRHPNYGRTSLIEKNIFSRTKSLQRDKHFLGSFSSEIVNEILQVGRQDLKKFHTNALRGQLKRDDLSVNSGKTARSIRTILNKEYRSQGVLDAISMYTGLKTTVTGVSLELSVPQSTWWRHAIPGVSKEPRTLYAHLDESVGYPKSIVYLSDVKESNGPTSCYPGMYESLELNPLQEMIGRVIGIVGSSPNSKLHDYYQKQYHQSMNSEKFRKHFMKLPKSLRFNSHMGWDVVPGSSSESFFSGLEKKVLGAAGSFIVFDGAKLFHRGGLVNDGERVALQVIFSDLSLAERAFGKLKKMVA